MSLVLHQFDVRWDLPNPSPFCMKVETFLRLAALDYEVVPWSPTGAPLGKAPYVVLDGEVIPDSSRIVRVLLELPHVHLDEPHSADALARVLPVQRMLEEHTYWGLLSIRWLQNDVWATYRDVLGTVMPALVRRPAMAWLRRGVRQAAHAHGLARHPRDEILRRIRADLEAVALQIEGPFLLGEHPCHVDATVYAFVEPFAHPVGMDDLADLFAPGTPLRAYLEAMRTRAWDDWTFTS